MVCQLIVVIIRKERLYKGRVFSYCIQSDNCFFLQECETNAPVVARRLCLKNRCKYIFNFNPEYINVILKYEEYRRSRVKYFLNIFDVKLVPTKLALISGEI